MKKLIVFIMLVTPFYGFSQERDIQEGISLQEQGNHTEARIFFEDVVSKHADDHQALFYLGVSEFYLNDFNEAEQRFQSAIGIEPNRSDYYLWLGKTYKEKLQMAGFFEKGILSGKALDNYKKAVKVDPANVPARIHLANYYIHAPSIGGGSISKAKEQVEEIKEYDPEEAMMLMAEIYMSEEKYDLAIDEYKRFLELEPGNVNAYYRLGMLYQGLKQYNEAMRMFETVIEMDENEYHSLYQVGRTAIFSEENIKRGIACMQDYIQANPGSPYPSADAAHWRLGMLFELNGEKGRAMDEYKIASGMNPDEKKYKEAIANLQ